ncbi:hydroxypyruvate isomerase family protein [Marinospirillum insulare]|uniref:Hydroxypyruvate isomerase n=1 Tax=Marinospirillum insulare TaxID=217169 RepID=A0ABQ5ZZN1_9GAMM|nr:TIM barrel protein [Marinospirillum insulare]GLR64976.1 hydroxypyruvate isomerase [Marinospirillum insulare]
MKIAANISLMFNDLPLQERPSKAAELGFQGIEVQFPYELPVETWQALLAEADLPLILVNLPAGDLMQGGDGLACHPKRQNEFIQALELSLPYIEKLQPEVVNILAGRQVAGFSEQACLNQLIKNISLACKTLADYPITVSCEPINNLDQPNYLISRASDWQALAKQVNQPNFGLQLDLYHAARMQEPLTQLLDEYAAALAHIQFADYPGRSHPGSGEIDLQAIFNQLKQLGYSGWLAAEFPSASTDSYAWLTQLKYNP